MTKSSYESLLEGATRQPSGSTPVDVLRWRDGTTEQCTDRVAEEVPVALVYNDLAHAVMMATPEDLEDFAVGFSLTEGIADKADDIYEIESARRGRGIELGIRLSGQRFALLSARRRSLAGRTGCGICGSESLEQAMQPVPPVPFSNRYGSSAVQRAVNGLAHHQALQAHTGAVHAAAWADAEGQIELIREDVGRHNALDKLIGLIARNARRSSRGFILVSSRASYEMVAKAAVVGCELLVALSAPTSLAIDVAEECGMTLVGFARAGRQSIYTHSQRLE